MPIMTLRITQNTRMKVQKYSQIQSLYLPFSRLKLYFHCTWILENSKIPLSNSPIIFLFWKKINIFTLKKLTEKKILNQEF
jgi:hypothetical protein